MRLCTTDVTLCDCDTYQFVTKYFVHCMQVMYFNCTTIRICYGITEASMSCIKLRTAYSSKKIIQQLAEAIKQVLGGHSQNGPKDMVIPLQRKNLRGQ